MKCFVHQDRDALGLCNECVAEVDGSLACKNSHEEGVQVINSLIENNKQSYSHCIKTSLVSNLSLLLFGLIFIYFGYSEDKAFLLYLGVGFLVYWLFIFIYNLIFFKKLNTDYNKK